MHNNVNHHSQTYLDNIKNLLPLAKEEMKELIKICNEIADEAIDGNATKCTIEENNKRINVITRISEALNFRNNTNSAMEKLIQSIRQINLKKNGTSNTSKQTLEFIIADDDEAAIMNEKIKKPLNKYGNAVLMLFSLKKTKDCPENSSYTILDCQFSKSQLKSHIDYIDLRSKELFSAIENNIIKVKPNHNSFAVVIARNDILKTYVPENQAQTTKDECKYTPLVAIAKPDQITISHNLGNICIRTQNAKINVDKTSLLTDKDIENAIKNEIAKISQQTKKDIKRKRINYMILGLLIFLPIFVGIFCVIHFNSNDKKDKAGSFWGLIIIIIIFLFYTFFIFNNISQKAKTKLKEIESLQRHFDVFIQSQENHTYIDTNDSTIKTFAKDEQNIESYAQPIEKYDDQLNEESNAESMEGYYDQLGEESDAKQQPIEKYDDQLSEEPNAESMEGYYDQLGEESDAKQQPLEKYDDQLSEESNAESMEGYYDQLGEESDAKQQPLEKYDDQLSEESNAAMEECYEQLGEESIENIDQEADIVLEKPIDDAKTIYPIIAKTHKI